MNLPEGIFEKEELLEKGHFGCQGCGAALGLRMALKVLGKKTIMVLPASCSSVIAAPYPLTSIKVPLLHTAFETAASAASGVSAALRVRGMDDVNVLAWAGDGGTFDIGLQSLSGAAERNEDIIYICYDNEAYMNTGIQRSSATPFGAATTTSPAGKVVKGQQTWKKNMPEIMAAHNIPYVATVNPSYPFDLFTKVQKAVNTPGPAYIHVYASCPTGWRMRPELAVQVGRLATETGVFPLYEVENGKYKINYELDEFRPLRDYLKVQGRFRHLSDHVIDASEKRLRKEYKLLQAKVRMTTEESDGEG